MQVRPRRGRNGSMTGRSETTVRQKIANLRDTQPIILTEDLGVTQFRTPHISLYSFLFIRPLYNNNGASKDYFEEPLSLGEIHP